MLESISDRNKHIAIGAALGVFFTLSTTAIVLASKGRLFTDDAHRRKTHSLSKKSDQQGSSIAEVGQGNTICDGVAGLIGNTPMMRIKSLSDATGCEILAKAEVP